MAFFLLNIDIVEQHKQRVKWAILTATPGAQPLKEYFNKLKTK